MTIYIASDVHFCECGFKGKTKHVGTEPKALAILAGSACWRVTYGAIDGAVSQYQQPCPKRPAIH